MTLNIFIHKPSFSQSQSNIHYLIYLMDNQLTKFGYPGQHIFVNIITHQWSMNRGAASPIITASSCYIQSQLSQWCDKVYTPMNIIIINAVLAAAMIGKIKASSKTPPRCKICKVKWHTNQGSNTNQYNLWCFQSPASLKKFYYGSAQPTETLFDHSCHHC